MSRRQFHIHVYGKSDPSLTDDAQLSRTRRTNPLPTNFDAAEARLTETLSALFEPDGSFAWASTTHQIVGIIYDAASEIQYVELRGECDQARLRLFIETLAGTNEIDDFAVMVLPERQWKTFQSFERSRP